MNDLVISPSLMFFNGLIILMLMLKIGRIQWVKFMYRMQKYWEPAPDIKIKLQLDKDLILLFII